MATRFGCSSPAARNLGNPVNSSCLSRRVGFILEIPALRVIRFVNSSNSPSIDLRSFVNSFNSPFPLLLFSFYFLVFTSHLLRGFSLPSPCFLRGLHGGGSVRVVGVSREGLVRVSPGRGVLPDSESRCKDTNVFRGVRAIACDGVRLRAITCDYGVYGAPSHSKIACTWRGVKVLPEVL